MLGCQGFVVCKQEDSLTPDCKRAACIALQWEDGLNVKAQHKIQDRINNAMCILPTSSDDINCQPTSSGDI